MTRSYTVEKENVSCIFPTFLFVHGLIIRTVVRIVGMDRMSHICNTKCSRL